MKPILKLYIKEFLITGLTFASLTAVTGYFDGESFRIGKFLFYAILFGGAMSLALVSMLEENLRDLGITNPTEENLRAVQQTELISKVSKEKFISKLSKDKVMSRMKLKTNEKIIKLNSGVTWKSWGESITIKISSASEGMFKYQIQSKPKLPINIIDFGKNLENIIMIQKLVKNTD